MSVPFINPPANHLSEVLPSTLAEAVTILIVDDEAPIRRMLKAILKRQYQVVEAGEVAQAIELAEAIKPDLVLLDLTLAGYGNGLDVCQALRHESDPALSQIPILVVTGETTQPVMKTALEAGATACLGKPYSPPVLLEMITKMLTKE